LEKLTLLPLTKKRLAQKIKAGDQQALEKLTKANLRCFGSKTIQNQGLTLPDLINEKPRSYQSSSTF
jgi:RNA polymerase primary sigma factor